MPLDGTYAPQLDESLYPGNRDDLQYQPFFGTEGFPQFGGGGMGMAANMGLGIFAQQTMAPMGMMPMGLSDTNIYDRMQRQRMTRMHDDLLRSAAQQGKASTVQAIRGGFALAGQPYGAEQQKLAETSADQMAAITPLMAQFAPQLLDMFGGDRGRVESMMEYMHRGGQYRIDPVSGQMGMSGDSMKNVFSKVYDDLYAGDKYKERQGISAGQMGEMFNALVQRGMMPGGGTALDLADTNPNALTNATERALQRPLTAAERGNMKQTLRGLSSDQLDRVSMDAEVSPELEKFDAKKIETTLKKYQGAVAAMRDIFGGAGKPNAPMSELINALQQMTGDALTQMDPQQVENMVRTNAGLADKAGIGLAGAAMIQGRNMAQAEAMGANPIMATYATQHELAMRGAYGGLGFAGAPAWGAWGQERFSKEAGGAMLRATQAASTQQMATAGRLQEVSGLGDAFYKQGAEGQRLKSYMEAVRTGQTEFTDPATGKRQGVLMSHGEFVSMMQAGTAQSMDRGDIERMLSQRDANQEWIARNPLAAQVTRRLQRTEMVNRAVAATGMVMGNQFEGGGVGFDRAQELGQGASRAVLQNYMQMAEADKGDPAKRAQVMAQALKQQLQGTAEGRQLLARQGDEKHQQAWLRTRAEDIFDEANSDRVIQRAGGMINLSRLHGDAAQDRSQRTVAVQKAENDLKRTFSGLGRGGLIQNAMEALMNIDPEDEKSLQKALGETFGGIEPGKLTPGFQAAITRLQKERDVLKNVEAAAAADPENKAKQALLQSTRAGLTDAQGKFEAELKQLKGFQEAAGKSDADLAKLQQGDTSGLSPERKKQWETYKTEMGFKTDKQLGEFLQKLADPKQAPAAMREAASRITGDPWTGLEKEHETLNKAAERISKARGGKAVTAEDLVRGSGEDALGRWKDKDAGFMGQSLYNLEREEVEAAKKVRPGLVEREKSHADGDKGAPDGSGGGAGGTVNFKFGYIKIEGLDKITMTAVRDDAPAGGEGSANPN